MRKDGFEKNVYPHDIVGMGNIAKQQVIWFRWAVKRYSYVKQQK